MFDRNSGEWRLWGGGRWLVGAQNSVPSAAVEKQWSLAAIGFHGTLLSEFINFFFKLLIGFYLVNLVAMLKFVNVSLMW